MSKRLSDTEKWSDSWFVELSLAAKSLFLFLCDMCDIAGFYERSDKIMKFYLSFNKNTLNKATAEISKSVIFKNGVYFVKNFIAHQKNLPLNLNNHCHIGIIQRLKKRSKDFYDFYDDEIKISLAPSKGLGSPYGKGKGKGTSKGKSVEVKGGMGGEKEKAYFDFEAFWQIYPKRNGLKVGKQAALEEFKRQIKSQEDYDKLLNATQHYATGNHFIRDAVRFLKQAYWKDWYVEPPEKCKCYLCGIEYPKKEMKYASPEKEREEMLCQGCYSKLELELLTSIEQEKMHILYEALK